MTSFTASHKTYGPPNSVTWLQLLRKRTNTGTSTALIAETHCVAHTTSRTRPTCGIVLGSLTLPAPQAREFVKLILLYPLPWRLSGLQGPSGRVWRRENYITVSTSYYRQRFKFSRRSYSLIPDGLVYEHIQDKTILLTGVSQYSDRSAEWLIGVRFPAHSAPM